MKHLLWVLAFAVACGSDPAGPAAPQYDRQYVLTELRYEDVAPDLGYSIFMGDSSMRGGPAVLGFNDSTGALWADVALSNLLYVTDIDTSYIKAIDILPAQVFEFNYVLGTLGQVVFYPVNYWPMNEGGVLTDSTFVHDTRVCFNDDCTDYTYFHHRWVRQ